MNKSVAFSPQESHNSQPDSYIYWEMTVWRGNEISIMLHQLYKVYFVNEISYLSIK